MQKYYDILKKCRLFDDIKDTDLTAMLGCLGAVVRSYRKDQTIINEGEKAAYIGVMLSGSAQIVRTDYYGNRSIILSAEPSQLFAESFVCAGVEYVPVNVIAAEACEVMLIDGKRIMRTCGNGCDFHSQMMFNLVKLIASKNLLCNKKIEIISKRSTREKLMTYLIEQAKACNSASFTIPYDRQELADYLEVDRSGLSAEISKLRKEGILECHRSSFKIINENI